MTRSVFIPRPAANPAFLSRHVAPTLIFLLGSAISAQSAPTTAPLFGPTGLGTVPTTQTVPAGSLEVGGSYENIDPDVGRARFFPELTATFGFRRGEIGVGTLEEDFRADGTNFDRRYLTIHAKYRVFESARSGAALAVGAQYLDFSKGGGNVSTLSLTGSLPVRIAPRRLNAAPNGDNPANSATLHLGAFYHRVQDGDNRARPFIGIEAPLFFGAVKPDSTSKLSLAADFAPRAGDIDSLASLALRLQSQRGFGAQLGIGAIGGDRKIFAGVTYRFGFGS